MYIGSIIVVFNVICVNDDIFASIGGNVTTNDTLNGAAVTVNNAKTIGQLSVTNLLNKSI
jgi:hypothetical protein